MIIMPRRLIMKDNQIVKSGNLFSDLPNSIDNETFESVFVAEGCKIERIISKGHHSPDGFWYDQEKNEWVVLLKGSAGLIFENGEEIIEMMPGDYIHIPAHCKHRVEWTDPDVETIWLAVHY